MPQPDSSYIARSEVPAQRFWMRPQARGGGSYSQRTSTVLVKCDRLLHSLIYTLCGMSTNASKVRPGVGPIESLQPSETGHYSGVLWCCADMVWWIKRLLVAPWRSAFRERGPFLWAHIICAGPVCRTVLASFRSTCGKAARIYQAVGSRLSR